MVHVIHDGEPEGVGMNIPTDNILHQIEVLNEDFRRRPGTRGWNEDPRGADARIEFVLARRDPNGNPTTGINRINRHLQGWTAPPYDKAYIENTIKPATIWDPTQYFNIWVMELEGTLLGYAQFPAASGLLGMPGDEDMGSCLPGANTDGIVLKYTTFGSVEKGSTGLMGGYDLGRTTTHEVGHWLGLRHTWGDGDCNVDDFCDDTPICSDPHWGCPSPAPSSCVPGVPRMIENYMDYSGDYCFNIFTLEQVLRMRTVLETCPRRRTLLTSPALIPPTTVDAALISLPSPQDLCPGIYPIPVLIRNNGTQPLTTIPVAYRLNNGPWQTATWTGNLSPGGTATFLIPNVNLANPGEYTLTACTNLPNDPDRSEDTVITQLLVHEGIFPFYVDFEQGGEAPPSPPNLWQVVDPDADCFTWRTASCIGSDGQPTTAMYINFWGYSEVGRRDELYTPIIDLTNAPNDVQILFDIAHRRYDNTTSDELRVEISTDCGQTWQPMPIFQQSGAALATGPNTTSRFIPSAASDWQLRSVSLANYVGQKIRLRFVGVNGYGNCLWIDNIRCISPSLSTCLYLMNSVYQDVPLGLANCCGGVEFYDSGGPNGSYSNKEERTFIFRAPENQEVRVEFSTFSLLGGDTLYVYNGASATLIGAYSGNSLPPVVTSWGGSLTFRFISDATGTSAGWAAAVECLAGPSACTYWMPAGGSRYVELTSRGCCEAASFYDAGGSGGSYAPNERGILTFAASFGQQVRVEFSAFELTTGQDSLYVYNGTDTTAPLLGSYTGIRSPFSVTSTAGSLTFRFVSHSTNPSPGWMASVQCINLSPGCEYFMSSSQRIDIAASGCCGGGQFYDSGGPLYDYGDSEDQIITFLVQSSQQIRVEFTEFDLEQGYDYLEVYDGPSTTDPMIGSYTGGGLPPVILSSGNALTFRFQSDGSITRAGWQALVSCFGCGAPVIEVLSNSPVCTGETIELSAVVNGCGPFTYAWSGPGGFSSVEPNPFRPNATPADAGTYILTVTDGEGYSSSASIEVEVTTIDTTVSRVGNALRVAQAGATYRWIDCDDPSETTLATQQGFAPIRDGRYAVVVEYNGCTARSSCHFFSSCGPLQVSATASPSVCVGAVISLSAQVSGGCPPYTYNWSGPAGFTSTASNPTRPNADPSHSGIYTLTVIDAAGTSLSTQVSVNVIAVDTGVQQAGATLIALQSGASYAWISCTDPNPSILSTQRSFTPSQAGSYAVIIEFQGCQDTSECYEVAPCVNTYPRVIASSNSPVCRGDTLFLSAQVEEGCPPYTYSWSGPAGFTSNQASPIRPAVQSSHAGIYLVEVFDAQQRVASGSVAVFIQSIDTAVLHQGDTLIAVFVGASSYEWIDCATGSILGRDRIFSPSASGSYRLRVYSGECVDSSACFSVDLSSTAFSNVSSNEPVRIYPNPTEGILYIQARSSLVYARLLDGVGREVYSRQPVRGGQLSLQGLAAGPYVLEVEVEGVLRWYRIWLIKP
ncbi:MAG: CUB domain-containing protein [Bacteroidia bacterium]|nr:CUB domain-containing protein [Bacteroidia bacterium]